MKFNPGKRIVSLLLLTAVTLPAAEDYEWRVNISEATVYRHEAVELHYTCRFKDQGSLYSIEMQLPETVPYYRLHVLSEEEQIHEGIRTNEYRYILFGSESGIMRFKPMALMRKTTRDSIENTVIGRDNIEDLVFSDTKVKLPAVEVNILPTQSRLSGALTLGMQLSATQVNAYEPLHVTLTLEGEGNLDAVEPFTIKATGVQLFAEAPETAYHLNGKGFSGKWVQRFALVAEESFTLPLFEVRYFDLNEKKEKLLTTQAHRIEVTQAPSRESLLDAADEVRTWTWRWSHLFYLLTFITGYIAGRWLRFKRRSKPKEESLAGQIRSSGSIKKLLTLLVLSGNARFADLIGTLERDPSFSLKRAKKEALGVLHED